MTIRATPLSAVSTILVSSFLSFSITFCSSLVMLALGGWAFFRMALTAPLNESASHCSSFWQTSSMVVTHSIVGELLDVTAKLGLWANNFVSTSVNGWLDRFTTHLSLVSITDSVFTSDVVVFVDGEFRSVDSCLPCHMFGQTPLFLWHNHSSLVFCLFLTLM